MNKSIKKLREAAGMTQEELAEKTGIPRGRINAWEQRGSIPKADDYEKVLKATSIDTNVSVVIKKRRPLINDPVDYLTHQAIKQEAQGRVILMALAEILAETRGVSVTVVSSELSKAVKDEIEAGSSGF